jgi:hypothetical protein
LSTPVPAPTPDFSYSSSVHKRKLLWKWSLAFTALIFIYLMWQCGSGLLHGRTLSNEAVRQFHEDLNSGRFDDIYAGADEGFRKTGQEQELTKLLEAVHRKLGNVEASNMNNLSVNATPSGTFITAVYRTSFARGTAAETFTWKKNGNGVKLYGYNIQSNALIVN